MTMYWVCKDYKPMESFYTYDEAVSRALLLGKIAEGNFTVVATSDDKTLVECIQELNDEITAYRKMIEEW